MPQTSSGLLQTTPTPPNTNSNILSKNSAPTRQSNDQPTPVTPMAQTVPTLQPQVHPDKYLKDINCKLWDSTPTVNLSPTKARRASTMSTRLTRRRQCSALISRCTTEGRRPPDLETQFLIQFRRRWTPPAQRFHVITCTIKAGCCPCALHDPHSPARVHPPEAESKSINSATSESNSSLGFGYVSPSHAALTGRIGSRQQVAGGVP